LCTVGGNRVAKGRFLRIGPKGQGLLTDRAHDAESDKVCRLHEVGIHIFVDQKAVTYFHK
jgi:hypothetical protein